jgi:hypothetical protein
MKNTKLMYLFAATAAAVLLSGCFNPIMISLPQEEDPLVLTDTQASAWEESEPFTVEVKIGGEEGRKRSAARSIAGPDGIQTINGDFSIRNFGQLVVMDNERKIVAVVEERRENDNLSVDFAVNFLPIDKTYHFLLLMGHWERDYAEEAAANDGKYHYSEDKAPTLLAVGCATKDIKLTEDEQSITITMYPVQVDTKFTSGDTGKYDEVEPLVLNGQPQRVLLNTAPDKWAFTWTMRGEKAYAQLKHAQELAVAGGDPGYHANGLKFKTQKIEVTGGTKAGTAITPGVVLAWDSAVIGEIGKLNSGDSGSGYFNLEYVPFNKFNAGDWPVSVMSASLFKTKLAKDIPVWIIRNGINDAEQDENTYFDAWKEFGTEISKNNRVNGNGAVRFSATSIKVKIIESTVFSYYVKTGGTTSITDENAGTKARPFGTVDAALAKLAIDYGVWKGSVDTSAPANLKDELKAWGHIYIDGTVTHGPITVEDSTNGIYPPIFLRDYCPNDAAAGILKLRSKGSLITVGKGVNLTLGGTLELVGINNNNKPLVYVTSGGNLTLADDAGITDNWNTRDGGGVYVTGNASAFTMNGGKISGNKSTSSTSNCGGVYVASNSAFIMNGGKISGNTAELNGGGVYVASNGAFTMSDGEISGNTAELNGGGVYICYENPGEAFAQNRVFQKTGGIIYGSDETGVDEDSRPLKNTANGQGQAVWGDAADTPHKTRDKTTRGNDYLYWNAKDKNGDPIPDSGWDS